MNEDTEEERGVLDLSSSQALILTAAAVGSIAAAVAAIAGTQLLIPQRRERHERPHARYWMLYEVPQYSESDFKRCFRLPRVLMTYLSDTLESCPALTTSSRNTGQATPVWYLVAIAVYRLAHGHSTKNIALRFDVGEATVDFATWEVLPLIARTWRHLINDRFPLTEEARSKIAARWEARTGGGIPDIIGAMDGVHIPVYVPHGLNRESFYNFKGFYSLLFLHVVDIDRRAIYVTGGIAGCASDCTNLSSSKLWQNVTTLIPAPYHLISDGGMPNRVQCISNYEKCAGGALTPDQHAYNLAHSSSRVPVEMGFGGIKVCFRTFLGKTGVEYKDGHGLTAIQKYREAWYAATILFSMLTTFNMEAREKGAADDAADIEVEREVESIVLADRADKERREMQADLRATRRADMVAAGYSELTPNTKGAIEAGKVKRDGLKAILLGRSDRPPR